MAPRKRSQDQSSLLSSPIEISPETSLLLVLIDQVVEEYEYYRPEKDIFSNQIMHRCLLRFKLEEPSRDKDPSAQAKAERQLVQIFHSALCIEFIVPEDVPNYSSRLDVLRAKEIATETGICMDYLHEDKADLKDRQIAVDFINTTVAIPAAILGIPCEVALDKIYQLYLHDCSKRLAGSIRHCSPKGRYFSFLASRFFLNINFILLPLSKRAKEDSKELQRTQDLQQIWIRLWHKAFIGSYNLGQAFDSGKVVVQCRQHFLRAGAWALTPELSKIAPNSLIKAERRSQSNSESNPSWLKSCERFLRQCTQRPTKEEMPPAKLGEICEPSSVKINNFPQHYECFEEPPPYSL